MNTINRRKKYIVLSKNKVNKLITEKDLNQLELQNILNSSVKLSFYEYLPEGIYRFKNIDILVDKKGNVTIGGKTLTPSQINRL